ncbi:hypothetical protein RI367_000207 [Sorochytrium milnesiophthora]
MYEYHSLPFCQVSQKKIEHKHETLGEALLGMSLVNTGIDIRFLKNQTNVPMCTMSLSAKDVQRFQSAVQQSYWYQFYVDDLPIWGWVGSVEKDEQAAEENMQKRKPQPQKPLFLNTHHDFQIAYNDDRIIYVTLEAGKPVELRSQAEPMDVPLTYSVSFTPTNASYAKRFERYLEQNIRWFSIANSFMIVMFLVGLVVLIFLRAVRRDLARYDKEDPYDLERDLGDEYGWKQVHGDVFRSPQQLGILSALLGTGVQLVTLSLVVVLSTIIGDLYTNRSHMLTAAIFTYSVAAAISGYVSASHYAQYGGKNWVRTMLCTALVLPGIVCTSAFVINFVAIAYQSTRAVPFTIMLALLAIFLFLVFPLTLLGTIIGRNYSGVANFPCRVNPIPRPVPERLWYTEPIPVMLLGGLLPFLAIFIEMYFIFSSFFTYKVYYVYGFTLLVLVLLLIMTGCVAVVGVYFILNAEEHRWHWLSFMIAGSTAHYVFLYSLYYYFARTKMYGLFQTVYYFGYTLLGCICLYIMLGTVGYFATHRFIRRIYTNVKID